MLRLQQHSEHRYTAYPTLSPFWHVRISVQNRQLQRSSKGKDIRAASDWAETWWLEVQYKLSKGEPLEVKHTLSVAYDAFIEHHEKLITTGESNAKKVSRYKNTWNIIKAELGDISVEHTRSTS
jgi:hypothetical protein